MRCRSHESAQEEPHANSSVHGMFRFFKVSNVLNSRVASEPCLYVTSETVNVSRFHFAEPFLTVALHLGIGRPDCSFLLYLASNCTTGLTKPTQEL